MNGWMRLYVFAALLVAAPLLVTFVVAMFNTLNEDRFPTYTCHLVAWDTSADEAREYLSNGIPTAKINAYAAQIPGPSRGCVERLEQIVSGEAWEQNVMNTLTAGAFGAAAYFAFFGVIYVLGRGIGWVWRGFFPTKA